MIDGDLRYLKQPWVAGRDLGAKVQSALKMGDRVGIPRITARRYSSLESKARSRLAVRRPGIATASGRAALQARLDGVGASPRGIRYRSTAAPSSGTPRNEDRYAATAIMVWSSIRWALTSTAGLVDAKRRNRLTK